jgi:hypothetical protein
MCYMVRQQQAAAEPGGAPVPPIIDRVRSRWVAAAGAALVGGFALAAFVEPSGTSTPPEAAQAAAVIPVAAKSTATPGAPAGDTSLAPDDGVPTVTGSSKAGMGNCHQGL